MENNKEIDIFKLLLALKRRIIPIIAAAILGAVAMYLYTELFAVPMYRSSASVYISNKIQYNTNTSSVDLADFNSSVQLVPVYSSFVKTATALNKVIQSTGLDYTVKELKRMVSTSPVDETAILQISVSAPDPEDSARIVNALATLGVTEMSRFAMGSTAYIIDAAEAPMAPYAPSTKKNVMIGFMGGVFAAAAIVIIMELLDTRLKEESDFSGIIAAPVLGMISEQHAQETYSSSGRGKLGKNQSRQKS